MHDAICVIPPTHVFKIYIGRFVIFRWGLFSIFHNLLPHLGRRVKHFCHIVQIKFGLLTEWKKKLYLEHTTNVVDTEASDDSIIRRVFRLAPDLSSFSATSQEIIVVTLIELML